MSPLSVRENSFDVAGVDGTKSGPILFDNKEVLRKWSALIAGKIHGLLSQMVCKRYIYHLFDFRFLFL